MWMPNKNDLSGRVREYVEAAKRARHCADSARNRQAKQILHEIERSYYRLVEIEKWMVDQQQYNRPMAHFGLFNGRFATREDIVSTSAVATPFRLADLTRISAPRSLCLRSEGVRDRQPGGRVLSELVNRGGRPCPSEGCQRRDHAP